MFTTYNIHFYNFDKNKTLFSARINHFAFRGQLCLFLFGWDDSRNVGASPQKRRKRDPSSGRGHLLHTGLNIIEIVLL